MAAKSYGRKMIEMRKISAKQPGHKVYKKLPPKANLVECHLKEEMNTVVFFDKADGDIETQKEKFKSDLLRRQVKSAIYE